MLLALTLALLLAAQDQGSTRKPAAAQVFIQRIRVVQGDEMSPVAGAEVRWFLGKEFIGVFSHEPFRERRDPAFARTITLGISDDQGELDVPLADDYVLLEIRAGKKWGAACLEPRKRVDGVLPIEIRTDFDVRVRVVSAAGAPVQGVPVCARHTTNYAPRPYSYDSLLTPTDAEGRALLTHVGFELDGPRDSTRNSYFVAIAGCLTSHVEAALDYEHPPTEPLELRMPPTGFVELLYEAESGSPIEILGLCAIVAPTGDARTDECAPWIRAYHAGSAQMVAPGKGPVRFPWIGLGSEWIAWAQRNDASEWARVTFHGPREPGETVRVTLHPPAVPRLRGRIVDERDVARAGVVLAFETRELPPAGGWNAVNLDPDMVRERRVGEPGTHDRETVSTDARGDFDLDFPVREFEGGDLYLVVLENAGTPEERSATLRIDKQTHGDVALGNLRLETSPVIASGKVKDRDGKPVEGAYVGVRPFKGGDRFRATTQADGGFVVRGVALDKTVRLNVSCKGFAFTTCPESKTGLRDLEITLERSAYLRGRLRVPTNSEWHTLAVGYNGSLAAVEGGTCGGSERIPKDGNFAIEMQAGKYSLNLQAIDNATVTVLRRLKDIELRPGETKDLGELSLDDSTRKITLKLVDPDGKQPKEGTYLLRLATPDPLGEAFGDADPNHSRDLWKAMFRQGLADANLSTSTDNPIALFEAAVPGYRFVHLENITADRTIELKRGLPVKLKLKNKVGAPKDGCSFYLGLVSKADKPREPYMDSLYRSEAFRSDGTAILLAPDPGKYWIQWIVERKVLGGSSANTWMDDAQQLTIVEQATEQVFELTPPVDPSTVDPDKH